MISTNGAGGLRTAHAGGTSITTRRFASLGALTPDELKVLNGLKGRTVPPGDLTCAASLPSDAAWIILSGWCARVSMGPGNHRQITTLLLPGDGIGIGAAPWAGEKLPVSVLTSSVLMDATPLRQLVRLRSPSHARLIEACQKATWLEQTYALNHIKRLGGQSAYQRVAHFLMELYVRLDQVDLVSNNTFDMPLTQQVIADALGLSCVHFNRTVRQMKREGLLDLPRGAVRIPDPCRLATLADFSHEALLTRQ